MTNAQLHTELDRRLDKAGSAYFNSSEKDGFLNDALFEFIFKRYKEFEKNEKNREDIAPLVRRVKVATGSLTSGTSKFFMLESVPRFMYVLNMAGVFSDSCKGKTITIEYPMSKPGNQFEATISDTDSSQAQDLVETQEDYIRRVITTESYSNAKLVSIRPVQHDDWYSTSNDPFNEATDDHPIYRVSADNLSNRYVEIDSETKPMAVLMDYIKHPILIDAVNNPSSEIELPSYTHRHLLDIAEKNMLGNVENQFRYTTEAQEIRQTIN